MNKYTIHLHGCDETAIIGVELTDNEAKKFKKVALESMKQSKNSCQPVLTIKKSKSKK
jgi:hypothetical protein